MVERGRLRNCLGRRGCGRQALGVDTASLGLAFLAAVRRLIVPTDRQPHVITLRRSRTASNQSVTQSAGAAEPTTETLATDQQSADQQQDLTRC